MSRRRGCTWEVVIFLALAAVLAWAGILRLVEVVVG